MNSDLVSIGEVARASGLSVSALRFYDREGVLLPARVDPGTGYRWYSADQIESARLIAGLLTALVVGWLWERIGRPEWMRPKAPVALESDQRGWRLFLSTILGDFTQAAGFLVIGAAAAATFKTIVPAHVMEGIGSSLLWSVLLMAGLAFILALCSEADAFVAASFSTIPMVGKLVFLTVGPAVDVKLFAMQAGIFGRRFAVRFAPLTFGVAVLVGTTVGLIFWGFQ